MFIIIISKRLKLNPDNIATPIASSLGDLITLAILSGIGTTYYNTSKKWKEFKYRFYKNFIINKKLY